jgi:glycerate 2-kinase
MKIVIAPDSFKGSLTAAKVADCIESGIRMVYENIDIIKIPMADGGEGTVEAMVSATGGKIVNVKVKDPLMRDIEAYFGMLGDNKTAVIEMASASGLPLLKKEERNPLLTSTYGTGELIKHALDRGCRNIIIGIGGSATNDGGAGMAEALGVKLLNKQGVEIEGRGGSLKELFSIDMSGLDERIKECNIMIACDVENPLSGPKGASYVYGPQKGADTNMVRLLDENLTHYGQVLEKTIGRNIMNFPGAGAAGGLGAGLLAFLNADLKKGVDIVIQTVELEKKLQGADLVITGEGMIDYQTGYGKTPYGVAQLALKYNIPTIAIAGGIGKNAHELYKKGFTSIFSIVDKPMSLNEAIEDSEVLIKSVSERIMRIFKIGNIS